MIFGRKSRRSGIPGRNSGKIPNSLKENHALLSRLREREVKYLSLRKGMDSSETIIGKDGIINIVDDTEIVILCNTKVVFRHRLEQLGADELMSLAGVNLRYKDEITGEDMTVIVYYKYHRN
ncbi:MAG: hypothetical protein GYA02_04195 [Clostridiaceae bacterium]|jgi:hypothetical protein|nr:hypothetical protein [Clostridiaceae bacterium]